MPDPKIKKLHETSFVTITLLHNYYIVPFNTRAPEPARHTRQTQIQPKLPQGMFTREKVKKNPNYLRYRAVRYMCGIDSPQSSASTPWAQSVGRGHAACIAPPKPTAKKSPASSRTRGRLHFGVPYLWSPSVQFEDFFSLFVPPPSDN